MTTIQFYGCKILENSQKVIVTMYFLHKIYLDGTMHERIASRFVPRGRNDYY